MKQKIDYYSTPPDFDPNDSLEEQVIKAQNHNQKIKLRYADTAGNSVKQVNSFISKVFNYQTAKSEQQLLLRQLSQTKAIYLTVINQGPDLGCVINGKVNGILTCFDKMVTQLNAKIALIEDYIIIVEQQINKGIPEAMNVNPERSDVVSITGKEKYFLDRSKINQSYTDFENTILAEGFSFPDYLACFDTNNTPTKHPIFISGKRMDFIYFLSKIESIKVNNKIAEKQFGIRNYKQQVSNMANRTGVFSNQVEAILKKY